MDSECILDYVSNALKKQLSEQPQARSASHSAHSPSSHLHDHGWLWVLRHNLNSWLCALLCTCLEVWHTQGRRVYFVTHIRGSIDIFVSNSHRNFSSGLQHALDQNANPCHSICIASTKENHIYVYDWLHLVLQRSWATVEYVLLEGRRKKGLNIHAGI